MGFPQVFPSNPWILDDSRLRAWPAMGNRPQGRRRRPSCWRLSANKKLRPRCGKSHGLGVIGIDPWPVTWLMLGGNPLCGRARLEGELEKGWKRLVNFITWPSWHPPTIRYQEWRWWWWWWWWWWLWFWWWWRWNIFKLRNGEKWIPRAGVEQQHHVACLSFRLPTEIFAKWIICDHNLLWRLHSCRRIHNSPPIKFYRDVNPFLSHPPHPSPKHPKQVATSSTSGSSVSIISISDRRYASSASRRGYSQMGVEAMPRSKPRPSSAWRPEPEPSDMTWPWKRCPSMEDLGTEG